MLHEILLRPERELPNPGMDAVGTEHQIEGPRLAVLELDLYPVRGLGQPADGVAEEILAAPSGPSVEDVSQVAAQDLDIAAGELPRDDPQPLAVVVEEDGVGGPGLPLLDLVEDAHLFQYCEVGPALEVDRLTTRTDGRRLLDDGHLEAVAIEPVREGGTRDARTGDEDFPAAHDGSFRNCVYRTRIRVW